jgi:hypothetical protein
MYVKPANPRNLIPDINFAGPTKKLLVYKHPIKTDMKKEINRAFIIVNALENNSTKSPLFCANSFQDCKIFAKDGIPSIGVKFQSMPNMIN